MKRTQRLPLFARQALDVHQTSHVRGHDDIGPLGEQMLELEIAHARRHGRERRRERAAEAAALLTFTHLDELDAVDRAEQAQRRLRVARSAAMAGAVQGDARRKALLLARDAELAHDEIGELEASFREPRGNVAICLAFEQHQRAMRRHARTRARRHDDRSLTSEHLERVPRDGARRSSRGGSWRHRVCVTRCGARSSIPPERLYSDYGFRVAVGR